MIFFFFELKSESSLFWFMKSTQNFTKMHNKVERQRWSENEKCETFQDMMFTFETVTQYFILLLAVNSTVRYV